MLLSDFIETRMTDALAKHMGPDVMVTDLALLILELEQRARTETLALSEVTAQAYANELVRTEHCWKMAVENINRKLRQDCGISLTLWREVAIEHAKEQCAKDGFVLKI